MLNKSKFYMNGKSWIEHIGSFKGFAICLKSEDLIDHVDDKHDKLKYILIAENDLKILKPINGNVIRKLQPDSVNKLNKGLVFNTARVDIESLDKATKLRDILV